MNTVNPLPSVSASSAKTAGTKPADTPEPGSDFHAAMASASNPKAAEQSQASKEPAKTPKHAHASAQTQTKGTSSTHSTTIGVTKTGVDTTADVKPGTAKKSKTDKHDPHEDASKLAGSALALPANPIPALPVADAAPAAATLAAVQPQATLKGRSIHAALTSTADTGKQVTPTGIGVNQLADAKTAATGKTAHVAGQAATDPTLKDTLAAATTDGRAREPRATLSQALRNATASNTPGQTSGATPDAVANVHDLAAQLQTITAIADKPASDKTAGSDNSNQVTINSLFQTGIGTHASNAQAAAAAAMPASATLPAPIGTAAWQQQLSQQFVRLTQRGNQQIELHLHPAELGPLQITLQMNQHTAQAHFFATHAVVRDAVQQALPQLREALAGQGIALGEALVGQQQQQSRDSGHSSRGPAAPAISGIGSAADKAVATHSVTQVLQVTPGRGVDLYA